MNKKFFIPILISLFSLNIHAETIKYPTNDKITKVFSKSLSEDQKSVINDILIFVDTKEFFSDYKKHLIKHLSTLNYKAMLNVNNEEELIKIAKYIFPLSMCGAYQFREDFTRAIGEVNFIYIKDQQEQKDLMTAFTKMNTLYLEKAQKEFNPDAIFFKENCSN